MNLLTLDRYLLYLLDALKQDGTLATKNWRQEERFQVLNNGYSEICKLIRRNRKDHFTRRRLSTDGAVFIRDRTFDCGGFQVRSGVADYPMPPDFLEIRGVRPTTGGRESVTFLIVNEADEEYRTQRRGTTSTTPTLPGMYWCAVTGERTLTLAPTPQETLDVELAYVAQMERLTLYGVGSLDCTVGSTTLSNVGGGTEPWSERRTGIRPGDEVLIGTTIVPPGTGTVADPDLSARYPKIATVSTAGTTVDLAESYFGPSVTSAAYQFVSVPQFHGDWHFGIAHWAVWELLKAIEMGAEQARTVAQANWDRISAALIPESAQRSSQEVETAEDGWSVFE